MMMKIRINQDFLDRRAEKKELYNQRGRTDRKFLMDLDAEVYEWHMMATYQWLPYDDWKVDAIDEQGKRLDVKFIRKYWNVSREKTLNLIAQRNIIEYFCFMEWVQRPNRPLQLDDTVEIRHVGNVSFDMVADNLRKSFKEPDGFYVDVRRLLA